MTMENPTLGGATMTPGQLSIIAPPTPAPVSAPSIYGIVAPYFARVIGAAATGVIKIVQRIETRPVPNKAPVTTIKAEEEVVAYVSGPRPIRAVDGSLTGTSQIKAFISPDSITIVPEIQHQVEFDGDIYVITRVKRLPLTGPLVAWRVEAERGA